MLSSFDAIETAQKLVYGDGDERPVLLTNNWSDILGYAQQRLDAIPFPSEGEPSDTHHMSEAIKAHQMAVWILEEYFSVATHKSKPDMMAAVGIAYTATWLAHESIVRGRTEQYERMIRKRKQFELSMYALWRMLDGEPMPKLSTAQQNEYGKAYDMTSALPPISDYEGPNVDRYAPLILFWMYKGHQIIVYLTPDILSSIPYNNMIDMLMSAQVSVEYDARCASCSGPDAQLACGSCARARYCSRDCAAAHWPAHASTCATTD